MADLADELFGSTEPETVTEPETPPVETPTPEQPAEPAPAEPQQPEQPRDEGGRFIPITALLDEREKRQAAERRAQELERQQQSRQQPQDIPDPYDDPKGYDAYRDQQIAQATRQAEFRISERFALKEHGEEAVKSAVEWAMEKAKADPAFAQGYMTNPDPFDWIVRQHQREAIVSAIPSDVKSLDELIEREVAKRMQTAAPAQTGIPQQPASVAAVVPRSLATAPGSGGKIDDVAIGLGAAMDAVFKR